MQITYPSIFIVHGVKPFQGWRLTDIGNNDHARRLIVTGDPFGGLLACALNVTSKTKT